MSKVKPSYCFALRFQPDEGKEEFVHCIVEIDSQNKTLELHSSAKNEYLLSDSPIETWKGSADAVCKAIEAENPNFSVSQDAHVIASLISATFEANESIVFFKQIEERESKES